MRRIWSVVAVGLVCAVWIVNAKDCMQFRIVNSIDNTVIAGCADSLRLRATDIMSFVKWHESGGMIRLYRIAADNETVESELPIQTRVDVGTGDVVLRPSDTLHVHRPNSSLAVRYLLSVDCVNTVDGDTTTHTFWKQPLMKVNTEARSIIDSTLLNPSVSTVPVPGSVLFVRDGCVLTADSSVHGWLFDRWSVDNSMVEFDSTLASQHVSSDCWPLKDVVTFTAWYRSTSTSVHERDTTVPRVSATSDGLNVAMNIYQLSTAYVTDLVGNRVSVGLLTPGTIHRLSFQGAPGRYILTVLSGRSRMDLPFLFQ